MEPQTKPGNGRAGILSRVVDRLPDRLETTLRRWLVPDESNLAYQILKGGGSPGVMVDVGACTGSALAGFANDGWSVFAFEPDPKNRRQLVESWGELPNVRIEPRAVSDRTESDVPFFRSELSAGISGLSSFHESHTAAGTVETTTLEAFLREERIANVDYLKVDTEGYDLFVLKGMPWNDVTPRVVVCEFEDAKTVPLGYTFNDLAGYLADVGYGVLVSEWYPIVQYGEGHRWRRFAPYPCTLADPAAWGNLIAVRDPDDMRRMAAASKTRSVSWPIGGWLKRRLSSGATNAVDRPPRR